jgi:hypothetical protein
MGAGVARLLVAHNYRVITNASDRRYTNTPNDIPYPIPKLDSHLQQQSHPIPRPLKLRRITLLRSRTV